MMRVHRLTIMTLLLSAGCASSDGPEEADYIPADRAVILVNHVSSMDSDLTYVHAFPDVPTGPVARESGIERPYSQYWIADGMLFEGDREALRIHRWDVDETYRLRQIGSMSLLDSGLSFIPEAAHVSPTRAYTVAGASRELIQWNPSTMEIERRIPADAFFEDGWNTYLLGPVTRWGDRAAATFFQHDDDYIRMRPVAQLAIFSADDARPLTVIEDTRCTGTWSSFVDDRGDLYVVGDSGQGWFGFGAQQPNLPSSCVLRVRAGESRFDPDYYVDLLALSGSPVVQGGWHVDERRMVMTRWPSDVPREDVLGEDMWAFWTARTFEWVLVDLDAMTTTPLQGIDRGSVCGWWTYAVDERAHVIDCAGNWGPDQVATTYGISGALASARYEVAGRTWFLGRLR